jgi:hypothetical protein
MKPIFILVSIISSAVLFSCASRKVTKQEVKKDSLSQIETKIVTKEETDVVIKNDIYTDEFIITPLDTCKDIVVNGIKYKNAILRYKKVKDNSLHIEKKTTLKNEDKKQIVKTSQKTFKKEIDKKANYFIYLWFILGIIIIYLIWRSKQLFL